MTNLLEIYKCNVCGNIVEVVHTGKGELVCCGQPMALQKENTVDAAQEKHVPILEKNEEGVVVKVGDVPHPMDKDHFIEWIEITTNIGSSKKFLKPKEKPEKSFPVKAEVLHARAYCNLHGLWKSR